MTHSSSDLRIDWTRCDGHGLCAALLPRVITLDEWGYPVINQAAARSVRTSDLKRVVSACPALALRFGDH
jgi:ferredoxin